MLSLFQEARGTSLLSPRQPGEVTAPERSLPGSLGLAVPQLSWAASLDWEGCFSPAFLKDAHRFQPPLLCSVAVPLSTICDAFSELLKLSVSSPGHK